MALERSGLRDISNTHSAEQQPTGATTVIPEPRQEDLNNNKENPVVSVIKSFFTPSQAQPDKPSRRVTKTRLLTSPEFLAELAAKSELKKKKEEEKQERLR